MATRGKGSFKSGRLDHAVPRLKDASRPLLQVPDPGTQAIIQREKRPTPADPPAAEWVAGSVRGGRGGFRGIDAATVLPALCAAAFAIVS